MLLGVFDYMYFPTKEVKEHRRRQHDKSEEDLASVCNPSHILFPHAHHGEIGKKLVRNSENGNY